MGTPGLDEANLEALRQLVDARYYDWYARELRPEQDRRLAELDSQQVSGGGRALLALRVMHESLTRAARERISIHEAVAREKTCWAMFSERCLDDLRQRIMNSVGASLRHTQYSSIGLKYRSRRAANAIGNPLSELPHEKRYEDVRAEILTTVNTALARLEAEGRVAIDFPERRAADSAGRREHELFRVDDERDVGHIPPGPRLPGPTPPDREGSSQRGVAQPEDESTTQARKRGRPQTIPDERKAAAAERKASGGSNSEAAALIYDVKYPSPQQVKNVPAILKAFQKKILRQSGSPIRTAPKPRKIKG